MSDDLIRRAAAALKTARSLMVLTGAGVSAESGVPTFRDAQTGLWSRYDSEVLASPQGFAADPGLVWRWYMSRLASVETAHPNPGHVALARFEAAMASTSRRLTVFTQNVDDLHERAGSREVHHLHGRIAAFRCARCRRPHVLASEERTAEQPPHCDVCGAAVRPDVVWFGEELPRETLDRAWMEAEHCDLLLVAGTSGQVYPVAQLPSAAREAGALVIDVNPEPTPISDLAGLFLQGPSGEILSKVLEFDA